MHELTIYDKLLNIKNVCYCSGSTITILKCVISASLLDTTGLISTLPLQVCFSPRTFNRSRHQLSGLRGGAEKLKMTSVAAEFEHMEIQQQFNDGVNNRWDADDWDNENSSARLFERSRIKALAGRRGGVKL